VVVKMGRLHVFNGDTVLEGRQRMLEPNIRNGSDCSILAKKVMDDLIHSLSFKYNFDRKEATALYGNLPSVREVIAKLVEHYKKFTPQEAMEYYYGVLPLVDYYFIVSKPGTTVEYNPDYETAAAPLSLTTGGGKTLLLNDQNALGIGNVLSLMDDYIKSQTHKENHPMSTNLFKPIHRPNRPTIRGGKKSTRKRGNIRSRRRKRKTRVQV